LPHETKAAAIQKTFMTNPLNAIVNRLSKLESSVKATSARPETDARAERDERLESLIYSILVDVCGTFGHGFDTVLPNWESCLKQASGRAREIRASGYTPIIESIKTVLNEYKYSEVEDCSARLIAIHAQRMTEAQAIKFAESAELRRAEAAEQARLSGSVV
jgi:hypothetical protein